MDWYAVFWLLKGQKWGYFLILEWIWEWIFRLRFGLLNIMLSFILLRAGERSLFILILNFLVFVLFKLGDFFKGTGPGSTFELASFNWMNLKNHTLSYQFAFSCFSLSNLSLLPIPNLDNLIRLSYNLASFSFWRLSCLFFLLLCFFKIFCFLITSLTSWSCLWNLFIL